MSKDAKLITGGVFTYPFNPFQDNPVCRVEDELAHMDAGAADIIVPRCGPFFARDLQVKLVANDRPLSMEAGDYSLVYLFDSFLRKYNRLVYAGIVLKKGWSKTDVKLSYDTIGDKFVLDEIAFAEALANTLTAPRTGNWDNIVNLPTEWPSDPHDHPASDTVGYDEMIIALRSYLDAVTGTDSSLTFASALAEHLELPLKEAHKCALKDFATHLKDFPLAPTDDTLYVGESNEMYMTQASVKMLIRGYALGLWR